MKNDTGKRIKKLGISIIFHSTLTSFSNYQKFQPKYYLEQKITENPWKLTENYKESKESENLIFHSA